MTSAEDVHRHMRSLPYADVADILGGRTPLILAPHPDDESLGCGGLIAAACDIGLAPVVAILTDGTGSHPSSTAFRAADLRALREREAHRAVGRLGLDPDRLVFLRLPDTKAPREGDAFMSAVATVTELIARHGCGSIYAPWIFDPHCDHEAAAKIARATAAETGLELYSFPIWGWILPPKTQLPSCLPAGVRLDISRYLTAKLNAIAAHASQNGHPIPGACPGFTLPRELLSAFEVPYEVFLGPGG